MLRKKTQWILQGQLYCFKKVLHVYKIEYVQAMFQLSIWLKKCAAHSSNSGKWEELPTSKVWFWKDILFWSNITLCIQKMMCQFEGHILYAYIHNVFFIGIQKKTYCEKGIAWAIGSMFDIEHRSRHVLPQWNALTPERKCACGVGHSFQSDAALVLRNYFELFEYVLIQDFDLIMPISKWVLQTHRLPLFLNCLLAYVHKKLIDRIAYSRPQGL